MRDAALIRSRTLWAVLVGVSLVFIACRALAPATATARATAPGISGITQPTEAPARSVIATPSLVPVATSTATGGESLSQLLADLTVAPEHRGGYDRDLFPHWSDADGDGCNTRYEVLIEEAVTPPAVDGSCHLTGGTWFSTYDGKTLDGAREVEIDHVVALAEAWYSGAYGWTTSRREQYANDLGVPWSLAATSHAANESKGSDDPAEWLPPRAADVCRYVSAWVEIKVRWGLSIDRREHDALQRLLGGCPDDIVEVPRA